MPTSETCRHLLISGRVQGVGYRDWAARRARELGLSGWVRNLRDGRVEVLACGDAVKVEAFVEACGEGPVMAGVDAVEVAAAQASTGPGFQVRGTG